MKRILVIILGVVPFLAYAQKYTCQDATVSFFSKTPVENIDAVNKKVVSIFNEATGDLAFSLLVKSFAFEKSLMEEHFNEKYLESDTYPRSTFQGKIENYNRDTQTIQNVIAKGKLTIHGVTHDVEIPGTIERIKGKLSLKSAFMIKLADYNVTIPQLLWQNIAEQLEVKVNATYQ